MRSNRTLQRKNSGQATLEAVLLMTVFVFVAGLIKNQLQSSQAASELVSTPWQYLSGMMETGVWVQAKNSKGYSPYVRGISYEGDCQYGCN